MTEITEKTLKQALEELIFMEMGGGHTVDEASVFFNRDPKTIRTHLKKLCIAHPSYSERVKLVRKNNYANAVGKRENQNLRNPKTISDEQIKIITEDIVFNGITLRAAEKKYNIPRATIHDNITVERVGEELYQLYKTTAEFHRATTNQDVESPIVIAHRKK